MATEIVINVAREESRVALIENKVVTELYFDRKKERGIVGNVYKGKIVKVLPGMQAAFIDIGMEKAAFLYVADIMIKKPVEVQPVKKVVLTKEKVTAVACELDQESESPEVLEACEERDPDTVKSEPSEGGEITENFEGSDVSEAGEVSEDEEEELDLEESTEEDPVSVVRRPKKRSSRAIEDLIKEGQDIVVQVSKGPIGTKGPRVTTYVSLPGRYLVYMPMVNHVGVSRRIGKEGERQRLKEMIHRVRKKGCGYIVRTVSDGITDEEFKQDVDFLEVVWQNILKKGERQKSPALLHNDLDLVFRTVRDLFTKEVKKLIIDSKKEHDGIIEFVGTYLPSFLSRVHLWDKSEPIFDAYGIEIEISKIRNRRVWLKSGGYLVIDHAEALTVIDVNTGRYVGKRDLEETIFRTNLEAVKEIPAQMRLRNIGGIIIIDLIDMEKERNREKVMKLLHESFVGDKARVNILKMSDLGLVQISRERIREDILSILCDPCSYCDGRGFVKSPTTVSYELFREIRLIGSSPRDKKIIIGVHPSVAALLYDDARHEVEALEAQYKKKIIIKADSNLHVEHYDIVTL
ncbi:MAG: Rne/Rng family ribonuclease [Nitrospirae bacterium]|nr:Rne/Rng family ribonuclease [Candidatus Manganitrophaceae bacterium]